MGSDSRFAGAVPGLALLCLAASGLQARPLAPPLTPEVRWTTGGLRPARAHHKSYAAEDLDLDPELARRIPRHLDPLDLRAREAFGSGIIEIGESLKEALAEDGCGIREAFSGGPYAVTELLVRSRSPNFYPHDYGIGFRFVITIRGLYRSHEANWVEPTDFELDLDMLIGEDGLVRADMRPSASAAPEAQAGAPPGIREHLEISSAHVANAFGPLELQAMEARARDLARDRVPLRKPAPGRRIPNAFRDESYTALFTAEPLPASSPNGRVRPSKDHLKLDLEGDGRPDPEGLRVVNHLRRIERGPLTRGGRSSFDFQSHAGWELYVGDTERPVLARPTGRLKFVLVGDTDGDGLPDLVLVEDQAEARTHHDPYHPVHEVYLRPAVYFLDGQDMARGVFDLGPVRFDFPPGADGSEIRSARLVARHVEGVFRDWDVELELFDPLGRIMEKGLVFDRYPANRKLPEDVGFQRAEFAGPPPAGRVRGVKFRVHFGMNKTDLDAAAVTELERAMKQIAGGDVVQVRLVGHTCEQQSYEYNLKLGSTRVRAVQGWLARQGIRPERMKTETRGEYDPLTTNTTDDGRHMNRRVDGWLLVRPAPPSKPPWYGRIGVREDPDLHRRLGRQ